MDDNPPQRERDPALYCPEEYAYGSESQLHLWIPWISEVDEQRALDHGSGEVRRFNKIRLVCGRCRLVGDMREEPSRDQV